MMGDKINFGRGNIYDVQLAVEQGRGSGGKGL